MRLRKLLRLAMVAIVAVVAAGIYWQWRPSDEGESAASRVPELSLPEVSAERPAQSLTRTLDVSVTNDGRPVYRIRAGQHVDFVDGWNEWSGPSLRLYGREDGGTVDVVSERMRTTGDVDHPDEVRMIGSVVAQLPGNGKFLSQRVDFDAVTGLVHTCRRSTLEYAGLDVKSACLEFQTAGDVSSGDGVVPEVLRMYQDLHLQSAGTEEGLPQSLSGSAEELRFRPGSDKVLLQGEPSVSFDQVQVRANELTLGVDLDANRLLRIGADQQARLRWFATSDPSGSGTSSGPRRGLSLRGDQLAIVFGDGASVDHVEAISTSTEAVRLVLAEHGHLLADRIQLRPQGQQQRVEATGSVTWEGAGALEGLRSLSADTLVLTLRDGALEALDARGSVAAEIPSRTGEPRAFRGDRLRLAWDDDALAEGAWPDGLSFRSAGRSLSAASATYVVSTGAWSLTGKPGPVLRDEGLELSAEGLTLQADGALQATGSVRMQLSGDRLLAAGPLFGEVQDVQLRCDQANLDAAGRLHLEGRVEALWGGRSLLARTLDLSSDPGQLRAAGQVELVMPDEEAAEDVDRFMTLSADQLLAEAQAAEVRAAGDAVMHQGKRDIRADKLALEVDPSGGWGGLLAEDAVTLRDPQARASGTSLRYDLNTGEILLTGTEDSPASFVYDDLEYNSTESLRVTFEQDQLVIETSENGRTRTRPVPRVAGDQGVASDHR